MNNIHFYKNLKKNKMKTSKLKSVIVFLGVFAAFYGCGDMESKHKEYLTGEKVYAGKLDSLKVYSGYERVKIVGLTRYLGHSNKCFVEWSGKLKEFVIEKPRGVTFEMIIDELEEHNYEFVVYTKDHEDNLSVIQTCTGKAMGPIFAEAQTCLQISGYGFVNGYFSVLFSENESEYIAYSDFIYEDKDGMMREKRVMPGEKSTVVTNWKAGGKTEICSFVYSGESGFDIIPLFPLEGSLPESSVFQIGKSNFKAVRLSRDTPGDGYGGRIENMWNDNKGGLGYHTRDGEGVPYTVTFDIGVVATIDRIETVARSSPHEWNPTRIQFWGCESIEGKDTNLLAGDAGWEQESRDKGWKLLIDQTLAHPVENMIYFDKELTKDVRFIRLRVLSVVNPPHIGSGVYGLLNEITLWGEDIRPTGE